MEAEKKPKERKTTNCVFVERVTSADHITTFEIVANDLANSAEARKWILDNAVKGETYFIGTIAKKGVSVKYEEKKTLA